MKHKHLPPSAILVALLLTLTILLALTGCRTGRGPQSLKGVANQTIEVQIWANREEYDLGEPVQIRAKLRNVSDQAVTLQSKSEPAPVVDIILWRGPSLNPIERWSRSQEYPNDVLHSLTLEPGESYAVEWSPVLSTRDVYYTQVEWIDNTGNLRKKGLGIFYGIKPKDA